MKLIPISKPSLSKDELISISNVFDSGWLGMGSKTKEFEKKIVEFIGSKFAVTTNTGTSALHLAMDSFGIGVGDEVIVPSLTYAAGIQAIISCGAVPVFCESRKENLNVDINDIKKRLTSKTKAIMPVHYCGQACDMDELIDIAESKGIIIIEDAAHAFGSKYKGKYLGSFGYATCFSFDPIKVITSGEGGAVTTNNEQLLELMSKKRILGIDKETWARFQGKRQQFYDVNTNGFRYHLPNFCAAIGLSQFKKFNYFKSKRIEICNAYDKAFSDLSTIQILDINYDQSVPFIYILRIMYNNRADFIKYMRKNGIDTGIHYIPNHYHSFFQKYHTNGLQQTELLGEQIVTIPLFVDMSEYQLNLIINSVLSFDKMMNI